MPSPIVFHNATLFDSATGQLRPHATVTVEGERIAGVAFAAGPAKGARGVDLAGRTLLPGLIDGHVHVTATIPNFFQLTLLPQSLIAAQAKDILSGMLMRGFTTVRDAGGADSGLVHAVERGHFIGPRLFIAGRALTQTGGHGDSRPAFFQGNSACICCGAAGMLGSIADGVGEVRRAAREELRNGAHHIKVMAGGGIASPSDPLDGTQYSEEELTAIVQEARAARTYVMAHAYTPESISRAIRCGVRSIEHGNLLDAGTAALMAQEGAFLVPTLATYDSLYRNGARLGWSEQMMAKLELVRGQGVDAIRIARAAGVKIGYGTDLLGEMHADQSLEFTLRTPAMPAAEILRSATAVNAELLGQAGKLGVIAPGATADLLVVDGNPLEDLTLLQEQGRYLPLIMKAGKIHKDELGVNG
ncbi:MAG: amidohydrolase family protein [Betaproteobacteria bacterium]|nr:amidohydrolase family protein [Betaproteobacteria bacterium]MBK8739696.1 amidohydrolase family protein [Betaproteobacteria bacterium]